VVKQLSENEQKEDDIVMKGLVCALAAFVPGVVIAAVNFAVSRKILIGKPEVYASTTVIRQVCSVAYLVAAYFVGNNWFSENLLSILLGAALGVTLPSFYFTAKLLRINSEQTKPRNTDEREGEDR